MGGRLVSRTKGSTNAGIRWRDGAWEFRCVTCERKKQACYWPLTFDFWDPKRSMVRCRACWAERRNAQNRARWAADPAWAEAKRAENRAQRKAKAAFAYRERYARLKADPVKYAEYRARRRAPQREAQARYRARQAA